MPKEINLILGERVKLLRNSLGLTREDFAEEVSVSTRFLAELESGRVGVSIATLKAIATEFNVTADFLLGISNPDEIELTKQSIISKINQLNETQLKGVNDIIDSITVMLKSK